MAVTKKNSTFALVEKQRVIISESAARDLAAEIRVAAPDRLFILTDTNTREQCLPVLAADDGMAALMDHAHIITIDAGDTHKTIESTAHVWRELGVHGGTRHSLMVNIGGGMVTDLGGFAASTFKRGIRYINVPTTLLAMVDASVGGKTGVNFGGLKNEVGVFNNAESVILDTVFLRTMDDENIRSGYAEMIKHGLISSVSTWAQLLTFDLQKADLNALRDMVAESVSVKERIVSEDPTEHGLRKALNLGHTAGHAFESLAMRRGTPVLHGYAVACGLVCELFLSVLKTGFPAEKMRQTVTFIRENYGRMAITCDDYDALIELMTHDKKNTAGTINFTLLGDIGDIRIDNIASKEEIREALDFYREC